MPAVNTKYRITHSVNGVAAELPGGKVIGELLWMDLDNGGYYAIGAVTMVQVEREFQRQGIATAMWNAALAREPRLHHSKLRTPDGAAWALAVGGAEANSPFKLMQGFREMVEA